ncbi:aminotransferase class III-fold pyridoxal phosphate-dependent enzyme, partial [Mesorhizobium sp. M1E.F.Ca.ET.041.01.1.1]|uniref:aspartate aminotransferase family protein n=1 Tax=Mesorhizobium sp. M1E.F.Ca.ET.041.01.1.1 TaxID=2496759 RepID=UPI000FCC77AF
AAGGCLTDVDGHSYIDFTNDMSAGFYGHSNPVILAAIRGALDKGISFGGPHKHEVALAEDICRRFTSIERVRFCNSGTEANLVAMGLARAVTGRPLVLAFHGGYHGSLATYVNVEAPLNVDKLQMRFARYNDEKDVLRVLEECGAETAAIIVEPMMASGGGILANRAFLAALRALADNFGALLIFDEVVTARLSPGGLQDLVQIRPDLTTLGKSLGGGLTFGAFGGRAKLIDRLDPSRPGAILHSGTFNNNVLTMTVGHIGLTQVATIEALQAVNARGDKLRHSLLKVATERRTALSISGYGSILSLHFQPAAPRNPTEITTTPTQRKLFHLDMLLHGFYTPRRGTINLSLATTDDDCEAFVNTFAGFLDRYSAFLPHD